MPSRPRLIRLATALACAAPLFAAPAETADAPDAGKHEALAEFIDAYRLAELWPQMAPKIARDSLPRLEDATRADIDADPLPSAEAKRAAQSRVPALLPGARADLEGALQAFDADELATWTAYEIYAKYFETQEIRDMTAFFRSDTGRKLTSLAPTILAESRRPGAGDVMPRHFSEAELAEITAFWQSPLGMKMNATAEQVREDMHQHFMDRSEPAMQAVARRLATQAESAEAPAGAASQ